MLVSKPTISLKKSWGGYRRTIPASGPWGIPTHTLWPHQRPGSIAPVLTGGSSPPPDTSAEIAAASAAATAAAYTPVAQHLVLHYHLKIYLFRRNPSSATIDTVAAATFNCVQTSCHLKRAKITPVSFKRGLPRYCSSPRSRLYNEKHEDVCSLGQKICPVAIFHRRLCPL